MEENHYKLSFVHEKCDFNRVKLGVLPECLV